MLQSQQDDVLDRPASVDSTPIETLLKDIVRRTRTCRNLKRRHCALLNSDHWDHEYVTPYEHGRMTRESPRLARDLSELSKRQGNIKLAAWIYIFLEVTKISPHNFGLKDGGRWMELYQQNKEMLENNKVDLSQTQHVIESIDAILNGTQSEVAGRMMLLKLSLR